MAPVGFRHYMQLNCVIMYAFSIKMCLIIVLALPREFRLTRFSAITPHPVIFLSDLLWECWIELIAMELTCMYTFSTSIICWGVSDFVTGCPCGVCCCGLTPPPPCIRFCFVLFRCEPYVIGKSMPFDAGFSRNMDSAIKQVQSWGIHSPLHWRHNGRGSVSNHQPHDCLLNRSFRHRSKKTSKLRVTS